MNKKILIIICGLFFLLFLIEGFAVKDQKINLENIDIFSKNLNKNIVDNNSFVLTKMNKCKGPVIIKILPEKTILNEQLYGEQSENNLSFYNSVGIKNCIQTKTFQWECDCSKFLNKDLEKEIVVVLNKNVEDRFDFVIQYYLQYKKIEQDWNKTYPSPNQVYNDNYLKIERINDINIKYKKKSDFEIWIYDNQKKMIIVAIFIFILFVFLIFNLIKIVKIDNKKNTDMFNYQVKDKYFK